VLRPQSPQELGAEVLLADERHAFELRDRRDVDPLLYRDQHHDHLRVLRDDPPRDLDSVEARHPDIEQDELGDEAIDGLEAFLSARRIADRFEPRRRVDDVSRGTAEDRLIVNG